MQALLSFSFCLLHLFLSFAGSHTLLLHRFHFPPNTHAPFYHFLLNYPLFFCCFCFSPLILLPVSGFSFFLSLHRSSLSLCHKLATSWMVVEFAGCTGTSGLVKKKGGKVWELNKPTANPLPTVLYPKSSWHLAPCLTPPG